VTHHPHSTCTNYATLDAGRFMCREHMARLSRATRAALQEALKAGPSVFLAVAHAAAEEAGVAVGSVGMVVDARKAPGA
jgi:hypothetical protein